MRMDGWKELWGSKPVMSQVRSHQKFWNPLEVFIKTFLCPAPRLKGCGRVPCTQGPQVTEAASGFAWLPVSWRLEIPEPSPCGLELLALGRQSYGSQSCNSPGAASLGRDEPKKMWVPGGFRGGGLLCLGPRVSFTFWKLQATHLTVQLWLETGNSSACLVHSCTPTDLTLSRCLENV